MMKSEKDTYDKVMGNNTLFSDSNLDEMQRTESYRLGFKVFRVSFFLQLVLDFVILGVGVILDDDALVIATTVSVFFALSIYLVYAALTSAKGIMAPEVAKHTSPWIGVIWLMLAVLWLLKGLLVPGEGFLSIYWVYLGVFQFLMNFFARRNDRVLKKQLAEEDRDEEDC